MPSTLEIKNRISAIKTTEKITKVMQMMSMSKISYVKNSNVQKNKHLNNLESGLNNYFKYANLEYKHRKYFETSKITNRKNGKKIYIVLSTDSGMSGSINSSVFKELKSKVTDFDILIPIGKKANIYISKNYNKNLFFSDFIEIEKNKNKYSYVEDIFNLYSNGDIDSINVIYANFVNNIKFDLKNEQIFPIKVKEFTNNNISSISLKENEIHLESLLKHFLYYKINYIYNSHNCSILSSRINSTTSSINNAKDLINELSIQYNKIRQTKITNQLLDLISSL